MGLFINKDTPVTEQQFIDYINTGTVYSTNFTGLKALTNSDIYTGVNIIAGDIAQSPFKPVNNSSIDENLLTLLNKEPKTNQSHYTMMYAVVSNLILTGNAYVLIHRNNDNSVKELEFVETQQVNVLRDLATGLYRYEVNMPYGNIMYKCKPNDILHFKLSTTDGWLGRSPLLSLNEEISLQTNGLKVLNNFFSKGVFSGGILKLLNGTVNNQTKAKIREDFEKVNGAGGTIVLDETQEFNENKINTEVLKLIQANKFSTQQIAKVLGIPINRFGQELVNSSDTGQNDIYIASTIAMYESSICDEINLKLGVELELDLSKLRQDTKEDRLRRIAEGKVKSEFAQALTVNDAREHLGFTEIEGGDALLGQTPESTENKAEQEVDVNEEISLQTNGLKVLNNFFSKGVFSGGILKLLNGTVNNQTKAKIREDFEKVNGAGGTIVLDETQEFNENKINTEVLKLIQANKFSTQQIAKVLGIPINRFGQELVNSSDTGQNDIYIASTIAMYESSICDEINLKLGVELELDLSKLRQDTKEDRLRRIAEGKVKSEFAQALTVNDAREYLGFAEIDGGDALLGQTPESTENKTEQDVNVNEELGNQSLTDTGESRG